MLSRLQISIPIRVYSYVGDESLIEFIKFTLNLLAKSPRREIFRVHIIRNPLISGEFQLDERSHHNTKGRQARRGGGVENLPTCNLRIGFRQIGNFEQLCRVSRY